MTGEDCMERVILSYKRYYDVSRTESDLFYARALFSAKLEQYFITRRARLSESDSKEHVFFALAPALSDQALSLLCARAWEETLNSTKPFFGHRNTDCSLIIITDTVTPEIKRLAKRTRFYKSYAAGLCGWSAFSLAVFGVRDGSVAYNGRGKDKALSIARMAKKQTIKEAPAV